MYHPVVLKIKTQEHLSTALDFMENYDIVLTGQASLTSVLFSSPVENINSINPSVKAQRDAEK